MPANMVGPLENGNDNLPEAEDHQYELQAGRHTGEPMKQGEFAQAVEQNHHAPSNIQQSLGKSKLSKHSMKLTKHSYK